MAKHKKISEENSGRVKEVKQQLKKIMTTLYIGTVEIDKVQAKIETIRQEFEPYLNNQIMTLESKEFQNMLDTAILIVKHYKKQIVGV